MQIAPTLLEDVIRIVTVLGGAGAVGLASAFLATALARRVAGHTNWRLDDMLAQRCRRPILLLMPLAAILVVLPGAGLPDTAGEVARRILVMALAAAVGWLAAAVIHALADRMAETHDMTRPDNLEQRRVRTQIQVLRRVALVLIVVITVAAMLTTIPSIRSLGVSLFASAGVAGLIIGLAARPTIANMIAGLQIALTQPIRLDDVVIVEGEWGWIEEIHTTYVVVRIWDLRRLIVPLSYFIEQPFQNWTRKTADILGTVHLYTDYTVPVGAVRAELRRVVEESGLWDGKVCKLDVTDTTERAMELRALVSAPDSSRAWDIRCHVREAMVAFLQRSYPGSLPRLRTELGRPGNEDHPLPGRRPD